MDVVKRDKKLLITDETGRTVYSPPDFLTISSREQLRELIQDMKTHGEIRAIMEFERRLLESARLTRRERRQARRGARPPQTGIPEGAASSSQSPEAGGAGGGARAGEPGSPAPPRVSG